MALAAIVAVVLGLSLSTRPAPGAPLVLAAASLQEALEEASAAWAARGHPAPVLSFAATPALARQVEAGAVADLFISADEGWMDKLAAKGLVRKDTHRAFLANRLVLIAPADSAVKLTISPGFKLGAALGSGRLALADPDSVPAGKYARAALESLGAWDAVKDRIAAGESVRAALALVERGQAPLGVVYATDAMASRKVRVIGEFPGASHPPIIYPLALLKTSQSPDAAAFRAFLLSPEAARIFARHGFAAP